MTNLIQFPTAKRQEQIARQKADEAFERWYDYRMGFPMEVHGYPFTTYSPKDDLKKLGES